ncbi:MAG: segregation/condensation protein A [Candidatus Latescibacterota bacterium]|nr:segregation/condensation protein A [Candidatus Latescibacterota bacterium]
MGSPPEDGARLMVSNPFQSDTQSDEDYGVDLEIFQGPLDLLLYLIRKEEVDVYDIPIADITRQYLAYVDVIQELDLEQAGDFVVMAATLMKVKSRMLLPVEATDGEDVEDPRDELVRRLLEYQQFKEVAGWLEDKREVSRDVFYRGAAFDSESLLDEIPGGYESLRPVGLFDLLSAFKLALDAAPKVDYHEVGREEVSAEERSAFILDVLSRRRQVPFFDLVTDVPRIVVVVTFIAILELSKQGKVYIRQSDSESGFWVYYKEFTPEDDSSEIVESEDQTDEDDTRE